MYGHHHQQYPGYMNQEMRSDMWIQQNIPGGLNSPMGEYLDNRMGGNPNATFGQVVGGYPGVGGYPQYGNSFGYFM